MADTLLTSRNRVLRKLGDSENLIWSNSDIDFHLRSGYRILTLATEILWKRDTLSETPFTGTHNGDWEVQYMDYFYERFNVTGGDWEKEYVDTDVDTPTEVADHTARWEADGDYNSSDVVYGVWELPSGLYKLERVTWDNQPLIPATPEQLVRADPQHESSDGDPVAFSMGRDGLNKLRTYPRPSSGDGTLRIEYVRRGEALSGTQDFEIPSRYVRYVEFYAMAKALEVEGDGQELQLSGHYMRRFTIGIERLNRRRRRAARSRPTHLGKRGEDRRFAALPTPRLPFHYPRLKPR